jgi:hypothetical protein
MTFVQEPLAILLEPDFLQPVEIAQVATARYRRSRHRIEPMTASAQPSKGPVRAMWRSPARRRGSQRQTSSRTVAPLSNRWAGSRISRRAGGLD